MTAQTYIDGCVYVDVCVQLYHTRMLGETCIMSRAEVLCFGGC